MKPINQQRLARAKFALPSSVTLLSIACGFASIVISVDNARVGDPGDFRLAAILLVLAGKVGKPWNGATLLDVPLAREDLAAMAGAATESVSRLLSQWQREGAIEAGRRWVAVADAARLRQLRDGMG